MPTLPPLPAAAAITFATAATTRRSCPVARGTGALRALRGHPRDCLKGVRAAAQEPRTAPDTAWPD